MVIAKQMEIRSNIKEYFDMAFDGETIIVPRKQNKNVVIISEQEYHSLMQINRLNTYAKKVSAVSENVSAKKTSAENSLKRENLEKLKQIENLKNNWNGNGASAIPKSVIQKVRALIENLPIQPEIFPTALMSVQMEFDNSRHDHMEIDINSGDTVELFIVTYMGTESEESIAADPTKISERVLQFYG